MVPLNLLKSSFFLQELMMKTSSTKRILKNFICKFLNHLMGHRFEENIIKIDESASETQIVNASQCPSDSAFFDANFNFMEFSISISVFITARDNHAVPSDLALTLKSLDR